MDCQCDRTPDIFAELPKNNILAVSIEKYLISLRRQKESDYLQNLKALHQSPDLELKHLHLILKYEDDLICLNLLPVVAPNAPLNAPARR